MIKRISCLFVGLALLMNSCKKEDDNFALTPLSDYYPLQVGKFITYNLDSTVFINFGKRDTVIRYQVQDKIDAQITDNNGRPAYRIIRYIRKNEAQEWTTSNTFLVMADENSIDLIENNLRFQKLKLPISEGYSWKGNTYLPADAYLSYQFASDFMEGWEYTYQEVNRPLIVDTYNFDSTLTVFQIDETSGDPQVPGTQYAEKTYSIEKYAKGIGLVYKEFLHWEYQENTSTYQGFGIKLTIFDYN